VGCGEGGEWRCGYVNEVMGYGVNEVMGCGCVVSVVLVQILVVWWKSGPCLCVMLVVWPCVGLGYGCVNGRDVDPLLHHHHLELW